MLDRLKNILKRNRYIKNYISLWYLKKNKTEIEKRERTINEHGAGVISEIEKALGESSLEYFATCGTLLGLIRENHLLKNDYDMDYAVVIKERSDWEKLEIVLNRIGYKKIREFSLDEAITEETYKNKLGIEIDFFGNFIKDDEIYFYSYDKLENIDYPSPELWSVYIIEAGKFNDTKRINTGIGTVTVPNNFEEYLSRNYNDNWRIPDPDFKSNTGKGCQLISNKYGKKTDY